MEEQLLWIAVMIGTVPAAISGALTAIEKDMDILGVVVIGCVTAVGGGVMRDVLLGQFPPQMFLQSEFLLVAAAVSLAIFLLAYWLYARLRPRFHYVEHVIDFFDAMGLAGFAVVGMQAAVNAGFGDNHLFVVFLGLITAVGGGVLRDILCGQVPYILRKRIYVLAVLAGALVYEVICPYHTLAAMVVCIVVVVTIRMLAIRFRWNAPRVKRTDESK